MKKSGLPLFFVARKQCARNVTRLPEFARKKFFREPYCISRQSVLY